jgi:hypothetical protein
MYKRIAFITLACYVMLSAIAQKWRPRYIGMTSTTHGYSEYLPEGYKSDGTAVYPLILYIHGNSERGTGDSVDLVKAASRGIQKVMSEAGFPTSFTVNSQVHRFIVIAPQFEPRPNVIDVDSVLNYVLKHYPVDVNRIYLTGFSMGGGSCWDYAGSVPALTNKLAALLPVVGSGVPDTLKTRTIANANLPVWATHNDSDATVPVSTTITYVNLINQTPAPSPTAKETIFHASGHNEWNATFKPTFKQDGKNVFEWMLQYQRRPAVLPPKQVKVQAYGGLNPYNHVQWNTWNVKQTLSTANLRYNDATASAIRATLSKSSGVADNGSTYGAGMAPAEVLRYASYSTTSRTLTLTGLAPANTYSIELYASRNGGSGYVTIFTINGSSQRISTYKNLTSKAVFTNLKPNTAGQLVISISNSGSYNYFNGLSLTEKTATTNQAPVANAGTDKSITLPTNTITLSGSGHDNDGSIRSYRWVKTSGPIPFTMQTPAAASTTVSGLTAGRYTFRLMVKDNNGATASDEVQVTVQTTSGTKYVKVNLYGGTNPYSNAAWNNWNVLANLTSTAFNNSDGSTSAISGIFQRNGVADNGSTYGSGMAPAEVLRYSCYATTSRTLILKGLSASKTYSLELYASRNAYSSDSTVFAINGIVKKIATYQNLINKVFFSNVSANAQGQISITINSTKTYNYLNGFIITEADKMLLTNVRLSNKYTPGFAGTESNWLIMNMGF